MSRGRGVSKNNDEDIIGGVEETTRVTRLTVYHDMIGALMDRAYDQENRCKDMMRRIEKLEESSIQKGDIEKLNRSMKLFLATSVAIMLITLVMVVISIELIRL